MKTYKQFNENRHEFNVLYKRYKCTSEDVQELKDDINYLLENNNPSYDIYYIDGTGNWNFTLYVHTHLISELRSKGFIFTSTYHNLPDARKSNEMTRYKLIKKEDIDLIFFSKISNKFNI